MKLTVVFFITPRAPSVVDVIDVIPAGGFRNLLFSNSEGNKSDVWVGNKSDVWIGEIKSVIDFNSLHLTSGILSVEVDQIDVPLTRIQDTHINYRNIIKEGYQRYPSTTLEGVEMYLIPFFNNDLSFRTFESFNYGIGFHNYILESSTINLNIDRELIFFKNYNSQKIQDNIDSSLSTIYPRGRQAEVGGTEWNSDISYYYIARKFQSSKFEYKSFNYLVINFH